MLIWTLFCIIRITLPTSIARNDLTSWVTPLYKSILKLFDLWLFSNQLLTIGRFLTLKMLMGMVFLPSIASYIPLIILDTEPNRIFGIWKISSRLFDQLCTNLHMYITKFRKKCGCLQWDNPVKCSNGELIHLYEPNFIDSIPSIKIYFDQVKTAQLN